jgi:hypothetical protein
MSEIENPNAKESTTQMDRLYFNFEMNGNKITGNYNFSPSSGEMSKGHFNGTVENNIATTIYAYKFKNKDKKEELIFKIDEKQVSILGGEKIEKNGINVFKDKSKGVYMIDIPRIDCQ